MLPSGERVDANADSPQTIAVLYSHLKFRSITTSSSDSIRIARNACVSAKSPQTIATSGVSISKFLGSTFVFLLAGCRIPAIFRVRLLTFFRAALTVS